MTAILRAMIGDLAGSHEPLRGCVDTGIWSCAWRFREYRLGGKVRPSVLIFDAVEISEELRRQGHLSALLTHLIETGRSGHIEFRYIALVNCGDHLIALARKLDFVIEDPKWRRLVWVDREQRRLPLQKPAAAGRVP